MTAKLKVGDKVAQRGLRTNSPLEWYEVVRVGRTNAYVMQHGREVGFNMETGVVPWPSDRGGLPPRFWTQEQLATYDAQCRARLFVS